jgi:uncharacterized membrane protein YfhO
MLQIQVSTDIHKFTNLDTPMSTHPAYDKENDVDMKTFFIPMNIEERQLPDFFAEYNRLLLESNIIDKNYQYPNDNIAWNDLLYLQYGLKEHWRNPIYSYKDLKLYVAELKNFIEFVDFTECSLNSQTKIQFRADEKTFYTLPELNDYPALFKGISEMMLKHFVNSNKIFRSKLTFQKEEVTVEYVRRQYKSMLKYPDELSYNGIIGGIACFRDPL